MYRSDTWSARTPKQRIKDPKSLRCSVNLKNLSEQDRETISKIMKTLSERAAKEKSDHDK